MRLRTFAIVGVFWAACLIAPSLVLAGGWVNIDNDTLRTLCPAIAYKLPDGNYQVYRCRVAPPKSIVGLDAQEQTQKRIWRAFALPDKAACGYYLKKGTLLSASAYPGKDITPPCKVEIKERNYRIVLE